MNSIRSIFCRFTSYLRVSIKFSVWFCFVTTEDARISQFHFKTDFGYSQEIRNSSNNTQQFTITRRPKGEKRMRRGPSKHKRRREELRVTCNALLITFFLYKRDTNSINPIRSSSCKAFHLNQAPTKSHQSMNECNKVHQHLLNHYAFSKCQWHRGQMIAPDHFRLSFSSSSISIDNHKNWTIIKCKNIQRSNGHSWNQCEWSCFCPVKVLFLVCSIFHSCGHLLMLFLQSMLLPHCCSSCC